MPSEMQERIARALHRHMGGPTAWGDLPERSRELFRGDALAAMRAMREPTPIMLSAAPASYSASFQTIWPKICGDIFTAMLDAEIAAAGEPGHG